MSFSTFIPQRLLLTLFLLLLSTSRGQAANTAKLNDDYQINWRLINNNEDISLTLRVKTAGWIGFGIGEPTSGR